MATRADLGASTRPTFIGLLALPFLALGCGGVIGDSTGEDSDSAGLTVPAQVRVNGKVVAVETNYLPRVVQCENPGAPFEALKAQAVAARTYLTYRADRKTIPTIEDGQSDQVYTCASNNNGKYVSADALRAVQETAGQIVMWNGKITAGFFVAGASRADVSCRSKGDPTNTEKYVTYNAGLTDTAIHQSSIGNKGDDHNRGCFAQRLANCLADATQIEYKTLLRYFYGSDVYIGTVESPVPSAHQISVTAFADLAKAACWSNSLDRPVPLASCVQSASDKQWYACQSSGAFNITTTGAGSGCTEEIGL